METLKDLVVEVRSLVAEVVEGVLVSLILVSETDSTESELKS